MRSTAASTAAKNLVTRLQHAGISHPRVLQALSLIPRELFIEGVFAHKAYENTALPIGSGQTISQPYIVAKMTELVLQNQPQRVLEIGTGSGYQAAILASLVPELYTVERIKSLQIQARQRLKKLDLHNVRFKYGDGWQGWQSKGPYDAIIVTAAAIQIPQALLAQLKVGGQLLIPVGTTEQHLLQIRRTSQGFSQQLIETVRFVPLVAGELA